MNPVREHGGSFFRLIQAAYLRKTAGGMDGLSMEIIRTFQNQSTLKMNQQTIISIIPNPVQVS